jgi:hypothetical protein
MIWPECGMWIRHGGKITDQYQYGTDQDPDKSSNQSLNWVLYQMFPWFFIELN